MKDFLPELGQDAVVVRLKRVSDVMMHDGRRLYRDLGMDIEPNWFVVFKLLKKYKRLSVTEIAEAIGLSHPSVISIVNKMQAAGYLREAKSSDDGRMRILSLSAKAKRRLPEFERVWVAGTAGFKRMMKDKDILGMLDELEARLSEKGFRQRTLDELDRVKDVDVVEFDIKYAGEFARLNFEWIETYFAVEQHDRDQLDDPQRFIMDRGGQIFFAMVDGEVAGTVAMIRMNYEVFELAKMAVSPKFRGFGIGNKLMRACVAFAREEAARHIVLESNTALVAAVNLYRKFGFVEVPLDPNSQFARVNIRMELALE